MQGGNRRGFTAHANTETILLTDEIIPPPALVRAGLEALPAIIRDRGERASAPEGSQPRTIRCFRSSAPSMQFLLSTKGPRLDSWRPNLAGWPGPAREKIRAAR